jgi:hypothetical protein
MRKALLGLLVVGLMATTANAAILTMEFRGGGTEITAAPSDYITIDVWFLPGAADASQSIDNVLFLFDYQGLAQHLTVKSWSVPTGDNGIAWDLIGGAGFPTGDFLENYPNYGAAGDLTGFPIHIADQSPILLLDLVLHVASPAIGDVVLNLTQDALYPTIALGPTDWAKWPFDPPVTFPRYYWTDPRPLIIHNIPEPASLALLAMGGLLILRRR